MKNTRTKTEYGTEKKMHYIVRFCNKLISSSNVFKMMPLEKISSFGYKIYGINLECTPGTMQICAKCHLKRIIINDGF